MMHSARRADTIDWVERMAVGASLACMVHCLGLPLLIAALPTLMSVQAIPESVHLWLLALVIPMAGVALIQGRTRHRANRPLYLGIVGLLLLAAGAFLFEESAAETMLTVTGSLMLSGAHVWNWRLRHS